MRVHGRSWFKRSQEPFAETPDVAGQNGEMNQNWQVGSEHEALIACVGQNFGPNPETKLDEIREDRGGYGHTIASRLGLTREDIVMDIGSGCGFVGRTIAPHVKRLYCVDISRQFIAYCANELQEFDNVECYLIRYADFKPVKDTKINRVYGSAVFIHFNYYDFYHYLKALNALLPLQGRVYFDYAEPEGIVDANSRIFASHADGYFYDRERIFTLVNYNSISALEVIFGHTGFALVERWQTHEDCFSVLIEKDRTIGGP